jgi:hypothetical protein
MDKHQRNLFVILAVLFILFISLAIGVVVLLIVSDERELQDVRTGTTVEERREDRVERREERREEREERREEGGSGLLQDLGDLFGNGNDDSDVTFDTGTTVDGDSPVADNGNSSGAIDGDASSGTSGSSGGGGGVSPDADGCRNPNRDGSCGDIDLDGDGVTDGTTTPDTETCRNPNRDGSCGDIDLDGDSVTDGADGQDTDPAVDGSDGNGNIRWITADNWIGFIADEEASVYSDVGGNNIKDPATTFPIVTIAYQLTRPTDLETDQEAYERNKLAILNSYVTYQSSRRELIDGVPAETYMVATRTGAEFVYFMKVSRYIVHIHLRPVGGSVDGVEVIQSIDFYPDEAFIESARQVGAR